VYSGLRGREPRGTAAWTRTNHRGDDVTLLEGPAYVAGSAVAVALAPGVPAGLRAAALLAGGGAGAFGAYDDMSGSGDRRGLRGHLGALAKGELTTGAVKIVGIGATGVAAGWLITRRPVDAVVAGGVIAGAANLANLLDLRPGRVLKTGLLAAVPASLSLQPSGSLAAAAAGPAAALLPEDLGERAMLGDAGANALGALLGVALADRLGRRGRLAALGVLVALTLASERVSFTKVIEATPGLRELDALGRRPRTP
jgi:hypothetical protein